MSVNAFGMKHVVTSSWMCVAMNDRQHYALIGSAIATFPQTANPIIPKIQKKSQTVGIKSSSHNNPSW